MTFKKKSRTSGHQNNVLTSASREGISRCDTVLTVRGFIKGRGRKPIKQGVAQLPPMNLPYPSEPFKTLCCDNMDESGGQITEGQTLYDSTDRRYLKESDS